MRECPVFLSLLTMSRLRLAADVRLPGSHCGGSVPARCLPCRLGTVFLELVVERLEADFENAGGARLVVVRVREGLQNQGLLGFPYGCSHSQRYIIRIAGNSGG